MVRYISPSFGDSPFVFFPLDLRAGAGLRAGISLRKAGDMAFSPEGDSAARLELYRFLEIGAERVRTLSQVHSRRVYSVPAGCTEGDGLVSDDGDTVLGVTVADCLPVFLYTEDGSHFGIVHSGWKGTGIAVEALELMGSRWDVAPAAVRALLGPCIGACCYNVPPERAEVFSGMFGGESVLRRDGEFMLDLRRANVNLLEQAGVGGITVVDACTSCSAELGSFRREGAGNFTRMLALIGRF